MKRFKSRKKRKFIKYLIIIFIIYLSFKCTFLYINRGINIEKYIKNLLNDGFNNQLNNNSINLNDPINFILYNLDLKYIDKENNDKNSIKYVEQVNSSIKDPLIYIYNTHDSEEYKIDYKYEYSIIPNVKLASYILQEKFLEENINAIVETKSIKEILNSNNWIYKDSYKASRILLENIKNSNPSIKYYIDIHRDSSNYDKTILEYNNKSYAKVLFIIGMENENFEYNLMLANNINKLLNESIPGISKGILKKEGIGVNGIYNQDFSNNLMLIEIGGVDNNIIEVSNTINVLGKVLSNYIRGEINEEKEI